MNFLTINNEKLRIKNIIRLLVFFIAIILLGACAVKEQVQTVDDKYSKVSINNIDILVEVVDTAETRRLGLSYREELDKNAGMLFDMQTRAMTSFWMKEMKFSLDIIWIDGDTIMNISKNLPPAGSQPGISYSSEFLIDYVLEVDGGFCEENNINIGDKVIFDIN